MKVETGTRHKADPSAWLASRTEETRHLINNRNTMAICKKYFAPRTDAKPPKVGKPGIPYSNVERKRRKMSATAGRIKCSSCQATWQQRNWAKRSRAYRLPEYQTITAQMNRKSAGEQVKG